MFVEQLPSGKTKKPHPPTTAFLLAGSSIKTHGNTEA